MLSTVGSVFFSVAAIVRGDDGFPTIYLDIRRDGKLIGQMRFNKDEIYSKEHIRMAYNLTNPNMVNPVTGGRELLEEIVIGGLIWASMDNHKLLSNGVRPYMVAHDYAENSELLNAINAATKDLLLQYGCRHENDMYIFEPAAGGKMLSRFLKDKQAK